MTKLFGILFLIYSFLISGCATSSLGYGPLEQRNPAQVGSDLYQDNNLSRQEMFQFLVRTQRLSDANNYRIIGAFEVLDESKALYLNGARAPQLDFYYPTPYKLVSFWTARLNGEYTCFRLSHVRPAAAAIIGPSEFWCVSR